MFLGPPVVQQPDLQNAVLIINTVLLIIALIVVELFYTDMPKKERTYLRLFYPLVAVLVSMLVFAAYRQLGSA